MDVGQGSTVLRSVSLQASSDLDDNQLQAAIDELNEESDRTGWSYLRIQVEKFLTSRYTEWGIRAVIIFNVIVVLVETDANAQQGKQNAPRWLQSANHALSIFYFLELLARFFVHRSKFFYEGSRRMDFVIVLADSSNLLVSLAVKDSGNLGAVSVLRIFRLARLGRALKVLTIFPELHMMVRGLLSALKATMWGSMFVFLAVLLWSIVSVQVIHPVNVEVTQAGVYKMTDCPHCPAAFGSIWEAAVTITQHVIAGDSWGELCRPIVSHAPYTLFLFVGMIFSINLLILNLVLAIVVERANVAQNEDKKLLEAKADKEALIMQARLLKTLQGIDLDRSGTISKEELQQSCINNSDLGAHIRALGVSAKDLNSLFELMDEDGDGEIAYQQFAQSIHNLQSHDPLQTTLVVVRHMRRLRDSLTSVLTSVRPTPNSKENPPSWINGGRSEIKGSGTCQQEDLETLYDSLQMSVSSINEECTKLSTMTDHLLFHGRQYHSLCSGSPSEECQKVNHLCNNIVTFPSQVHLNGMDCAWEPEESDVLVEPHGNINLYRYGKQ